VVNLSEDIRVEENLSGDTELEEVIPFKYSITSYGADFLVDGLVQLGVKTSRV
jgi:hypothetical protein